MAFLLMMHEKRLVALACLVISLASVRRMDVFLTTTSRSMYDGDGINNNRNDSVHATTTTTTTSPTNIIRGPIPHILWFTYSHDILQTQEPRQYYDNIMKTIHAYQSEWNDSNAQVRFLVNDNCTELLRQVDRQENTTLTHAFENEHRGDLKADLCRVAALYLHGGYYFDIDLEVVQPIRMDPTTSFSTVRDNLFGYFFQAFLASIPGHPVLRETLQHTFMEFYFQRQGTCWEKASGVMGPCTLMKAWNQTSQRGYTRIFQETNLRWHGLYPEMPQRGIGDACHWVVHDPEEKQVYFYSRIEGSSKCWKNVASDQDRGITTSS